MALFLIICGVVFIVLLMILKVKFALLWGMLAFVPSYIPNIGSMLAAVPAVLLAFMQAGPMTACGAAAGYIVMNPERDDGRLTIP